MNDRPQLKKERYSDVRPIESRAPLKWKVLSRAGREKG